MGMVTVIARKERIRPKKSLENSDGYVYTLSFDDPSKPNRYLLLFGYSEDVFEKEPSLHFVNPAYLKKMEAHAKEHRNEQFNAYEAICKMDTRLKPDAFTDEIITPEVLQALQDYELQRAIDWVKANGPQAYRPKFLDRLVREGKASLPSEALG